MRLLLLQVIASVASSAIAVSAPATPSDMARAHTKTPGAAFVGSDYLDMTGKLNAHLGASDSLATKACSEFSYAQVVDVLRVLHAARDAALEAAYRTTQDNRRLGTFGKLTDSIAELEALWEEEGGIIRETPGLHDMARDAKCHEAVMWYVHHLGEAAREQAAALLTLPLLPTVQHAPLDHSAPAATAKSSAHQRVQAGYVQSAGCTACHTSGRQPAPPSSEPAAANCIGSPGGKCPVWPTEFDAPFGLHATVPSIQNASSAFLYKFVPNGTQAQRVDYHEHCFPFVNARSPFESKACSLYFVPSGIYLNQPAHGIDCCLFKGGVGAVPPQFLRAYTYKGTNQSAPDMYGNDVSCDAWAGPEGFKYWTVGHHDARYHNWGHDIVFQDGPTGVTWRWGNFNVRAQDDSLFALPGDAQTCAKSCSVFLSAAEHDAVTRYVSRYHERR